MEVCEQEGTAPKSKATKKGPKRVNETHEAKYRKELNASKVRLARAAKALEMASPTVGLTKEKDTERGRIEFAVKFML
jgi:hypothetical protein